MHSQSQIIIDRVLENIDQETWKEIAVKAVSKMPKFKLTMESHQMFQDFVRMTGKIKDNSGTNIEECVDDVRNINQNYLIGTSKMFPREKKCMTEPSEELPKPPIYRKMKAKIDSHHNQVQQNHNVEVKSNNFFRLSFCERPNVEEQRFDETLRVAKYDSIRYNHQIQLRNRELKASSEHRSITQKKRFKQMKQFTYDYNGRLIPLGIHKSTQIKVLNLQEHLGNNRKTHKLIQSNIEDSQRTTQIVNKKIIGAQKISVIEQLKEKDKDKQIKLSKYLNSSRPISNAFQFFKEEDTMSVGVSIVNIDSKAKIQGKIRDKSDNKNLNLTEFKGRTKKLETFKQKISIKKIKVNDQLRFRTEGAQSEIEQPCRRIETSGTQKDSNMFTSLTRYVQNRGKITVNHRKLYSQNFTEYQDL